MATETSILGHSSFHFGDLQLSSNDFYDAVEEQVKSFEFPEVTIRRKDFLVTSVFGTRREYLCLKRHDYTFLVCAAPFGRSFFISWWLKEDVSNVLLVFGWIPIIGGWVRRSVERRTMFQIDAADLFKQSIKKIVENVVDEIAQTKGYRASWQPELSK